MKKAIRKFDIRKGKSLDICLKKISLRLPIVREKVRSLEGAAMTPWVYNWKL
ncbi:MAG: hypothetical protein ACYTXC_01505 [Nostoc sp.]